MQKENNYTVGQWYDCWFCENQSRWSDSTVGGYRNLIYRHILTGIGSIPLAELSEDTVASFYDRLYVARNSASEASGASICSCGAV